MLKNECKTEITRFDADWKFIKKACMTTIRKEAGDAEPSSEWKRKILLCEHSPIRRTMISWKWETIPYAISTHFVRHHEGCEKFVGTSRSDRTGIDRSERSQMDMVPMEMDANIQALINISLKRLCTCADVTTNKYWVSLLNEVKKHDEDIYWACVPSCIYRGGCPEGFGHCEFYNNLMKDVPIEKQRSIKDRYDIYYEFREKMAKIKEKG